MLVSHLQDKLGKDDVVSLVPCRILIRVLKEFDESETAVMVEPVRVSPLVINEDCANPENSPKDLGGVL